MILGVGFWFLIVCLLYSIYFFSKQVFLYFVFLWDCELDFGCARISFLFFVDKEGFL